MTPEEEKEKQELRRLAGDIYVALLGRGGWSHPGTRAADKVMQQAILLAEEFQTNLDMFEANPNDYSDDYAEGKGP